jgi:hypothetical protein
VSYGALGVTASQASAEARKWVEWSDQIVRDLDIPVMNTALRILDKIFLIADDAGVGDEVRQSVYAIRTLSYATTLAPGILPVAGTAAIASVGGAATAASASASVLTIAGAASILGAAGLVAGIASAIFGGGDDEEANKRIKRAQAQVLHLRDRLTLADFAAEQDAASYAEIAMSMIPWMDPSSHKAAAARAQKLAAFYRTAAKALTPAEREMYESISNLARWQGSLAEYGKLSQSKKDGVDVMFGTTAPRLPYQLSQKIGPEQQNLVAIMKKLQGFTIAPGTLAMLSKMSVPKAAAPAPEKHTSAAPIVVVLLTIAAIGGMYAVKKGYHRPIVRRIQAARA